MVRRILHIDMDAFYASVEQRDQPQLAGKPVIVGGARRGVVCAASYEARKYGVRSAMPVFQAKRLCPQGVYLPVRMGRYQEVSRQVMAVLDGFSPLLEQVSIDEAYLDITGTESLHGPPEMTAHKIKSAILVATGLTCSIGIAPNRFLAKIASEIRKPNGLTIIEEHQVANLLERLPVQKLPGVGPKTAQVFTDLGVRVATDILKFPQEFWVKRLGKGWASIYEQALGKGPADVVPHRDPKSFGAEDTFPYDTFDVDELKRWLLHQAESIGKDLRKGGFRARTITLKLKAADFKLRTRSSSLAEPTSSTKSIYRCAVQLLHETLSAEKIRLIGINVSNLTRGLHQARVFADPSEDHQEKLDQVLDHIQRRFGSKAIQRARQISRQP
jgi:DNA polymerase IV